ncbi:MAG: hypothetical protein AMXMBFR53_22040 [Gemmatimonadota bacterium]
MVVPLLATGACAPEAAPAEGTHVLGEPLPDLRDEERGRFFLGRALFERLATPEEGLGPLFNAERCSSCHDEPAPGGGGTRILVLKATRWADGRCDDLAARGGDNVQLRASPLLQAHGFGPEDVPVEATATAFVTAPPLFGLGLLEAVPEEEILRRADPGDADGDGVSGRLPRLPDGRGARFGRKGDAATVAGFVESALRFELGFTTEAHPEELARNGVPLPPGADPMPDPEMDAAALALLSDYVRRLAPPAAAAPGGAAADTLREGEGLFSAVGCAACHVPTLVTGTSASAALAGRRIRAFTDLLLHDLGRGDGDVCTPQAAPGEYRTAPLWGLRHRTRYLHDGSATTLEAAIAAHGGEGASSAEAFRRLGGADRSLLLRFLGTL